MPIKDELKTLPKSKEFSCVELIKNDAIIASKSYEFDISDKNHTIELNTNNLQKEFKSKAKSIAHSLKNILEDCLSEDSVNELLSPLNNLKNPYEYKYEIHPFILDYEVVDSNLIKVTKLKCDLYVCIYNDEINTEEINRKFKLCRYTNGDLSKENPAVKFVMDSSYYKNYKGLYMFDPGFVSDDIDLKVYLAYENKGRKFICKAKFNYLGRDYKLSLDGKDKKELRHAMANNIVNEIKVKIKNDKLYEEFIKSIGNEYASSYAIIRTPSVWSYNVIDNDLEVLRIDKANVCMGLFVTDKALSSNKYLSQTYDDMKLLESFEVEGKETK